MAKRAKQLNASTAWFDIFTRDAALKIKILDWIRIDQLRLKGVDADNDVIGFYSLFTSFVDPEKEFNTHYTLEDSGDFYKSMFIITFIDAIVIDASSASFEEMQTQVWWTDRILALTSENMNRLIAEVRIRYIDYARRIYFRGR